MLGKIKSAVASISGTPSGSPGPLPPDHQAPQRSKEYERIANALDQFGVPVSHADCGSCDLPCDDQGVAGSAGTITEAGNAWDGKPYLEYVTEKYGDLGEWPSAIDTDWESDLAGSGGPPVGRVVVVSTDKSDWPRDHYDDSTTLSHHLNKVLSSQPAPKKDKKDGIPLQPATYVRDSEFPTPAEPLPAPVKHLPALYSSSMQTQADDPEDQTAIVFPDWKAVHEIENSPAGAQALWDGALAGTLGRAGAPMKDGGEGVERRRSYILPYRAIVLLSLITCFEKAGVSVDETGASLCDPGRGCLESLQGTPAEREAEVGRRIAAIEGVRGGSGGEVGVFNISHLGGHRYSGVMLILFPSGAYLSYGRVTPQQIPRVVEETILAGKVVPGLIRSGSGIVRRGAEGKCGILDW